MILAVLDDLMFTSKIRSAAVGLGVPLTIARSSEAALTEMKKNPPSLVIFDLNSPRTNPIATITAMKNDAELAGVPTLGFVSHVDSATISAALAAGVGDVLARSAFVADLPSILSAHK